jgi:hypothetical protein
MPGFFAAHQRRRDVWRLAAVPILGQRSPTACKGRTHDRYRLALSARTSCIHGAVHTRRHAAPPNRETPPRSAWRKPRTLLLSGGLGLRSRHPNLRCLAVWTLWGSRVARAVWTLWGNPHRIIHRKYWTVWGSSLDSFGALQQVVVSAINMLGQLSPGLYRDKL